MKLQKTLQFNTVEDLWAFKSKIELTNFEISAANATLTFEIDEEQLKLAINNYNATIVEMERQGKTA
jgi:hypothetical protein